jgi:hypothetical protein
VSEDSKKPADDRPIILEHDQALPPELAADAVGTIYRKVKEKREKKAGRPRKYERVEVVTGKTISNEWQGDRLELPEYPDTAGVIGHPIDLYESKIRDILMRQLLKHAQSGRSTKAEIIEILKYCVNATVKSTRLTFEPIKIPEVILEDILKNKLVDPRAVNEFAALAKDSMLKTGKKGYRPDDEE